MTMGITSFTLAATLMAQTPAAPLSVVGTVTYRERIALPPTAQLVVQMRRQDHLVSEVRMSLGGGQAPIAFAVPYSEEAVARGEQVGFVAMILVDGRVWFESPRATTLNPLSRQRVVLQLVRPRQPEVGLLDRTWGVREIEGAPVPFSERRPTLLFSKADGSIRGFTGVNRFGGTFSHTAPHLQIDPGAMTEMAGPPERMEVEARLVRVLPLVNRAVVFEGELRLQRGENTLVRLLPEQQ